MIFLGIISSVKTFSNHADATMWIHFLKCPTVMKLSADHFDKMATDQSLDQQTNVVGYYCNWFTCPPVSMVTWTNLSPLKVIQQTCHLVPRSSTYLVIDILDPRNHSCMVHHDDWPLSTMVNRLTF
jgi:hypothetical protein